MGNYPPPFSARGTSLSASVRWRTKGKDELDGFASSELPASAGPGCVIYVNGQRQPLVCRQQSSQQPVPWKGAWGCFPVTNWVLQRLFLSAWKNSIQEHIKIRILDTHDFLFL